MKVPAQPLVSILTPSFNQGRWLADNLRSVAAQSYAPIEHIVMDGGSTDGSIEILASASPAVTWESAPDKGQSDAINRAFALSTGEIIGWLNSDDAYFSREAVARAVRVFEDRPDVGVVFGHAALVNAEGTILHVMWSPSFARTLLRAYNLIWQPTVFVRRSAIGRDNLVDTEFDYSMDLELLLHLRGRTRFQRVNSILAIDRHHLQRKSLTRPDLALHDRLLLARKYPMSALGTNRVLCQLVKIGARVAGLSKVREALHGGDALSLNAASGRAIAIRQVAQLRRWMPSGDHEP
jgi:glycosyltransferase involved in cell wall biosynthesis